MNTEHGDLTVLLIFLHHTRGLHLLLSMPRGEKLQTVRLPPVLVCEAMTDSRAVGAMSISEEDFRKSNSSKHAVKLPKENGGGRMAFFEFVHQIHCVVSQRAILISLI